MEANPYAPPVSEIQIDVRSDAEKIRQEHISTEAAIKSIGVLYYIACVLVVLGSLSVVRGGGQGFDVGLALVAVVLGGGAGFLGYGLRNLRGWARIPTVIMACLGLVGSIFGNKLGVVLNLYILVQMLGKKTSFVLTEEYRAIVVATPHVKNKTSKALKVTLLALLLLIIIAFVLSMFLD